MPIEEQLLPHKSLARFYRKVSWLYVCRTFEADQPKDREALRTHDRFGISSWPQMFLFDPRSDSVLAAPPRDLRGFTATFDAVLAKWPKPAATEVAAGKAIATAIADAEKRLAGGQTEAARKVLAKLRARRDRFDGWREAGEILRASFDSAPAHRRGPLFDDDPRVRALGLEALARRPAKAVGAADRRRARDLLVDAGADIVVRIRALRLLRGIAAAEPGRELADLADLDIAALLRIANDPLRYEVLGLAKEHPRPAYSAPVVDLFVRVGDEYQSRNPNVVRIRALESLGECGEAAAVEPMLAVLNGSLRNSLTRLAPRALAAIGRRIPAVRRKVGRALVGALPPAEHDATTKQGAFEQRLALAMAREIARAVGLLAGKAPPKVPRTWSVEDRRGVRTALVALVGT